MSPQQAQARRMNLCDAAHVVVPIAKNLAAQQ